MSKLHTPGPWRWEVNRHSRRVELCGGGKRPYDLTVVSFARWGLQSAAPCFWDWSKGSVSDGPVRADKLAVAIEGREHHSTWFADIDHPDACLIAAAPDLLEALAILLAADVAPPDVRTLAIENARTAITKATGQ